MIIVLSPAKAMNFAQPKQAVLMTTPAMTDEIAELAEVTRKLSVRQLKSLMDLSDALATLNREDFQAFDPAMEEGLQAAFAFNGDVYSGLKARDLDRKALSWAQDHVRILSGLYGLLRPLDGIQAYRLEMGTSLKTEEGQDPLCLLGGPAGPGPQRGGSRTQGPHPGERRLPGIFRRRWPRRPWPVL